MAHMSVPLVMEITRKPSNIRNGSGHPSWLNGSGYPSWLPMNLCAHVLN